MATCHLVPIWIVAFSLVLLQSEMENGQIEWERSVKADICIWLDFFLGGGSFLNLSALCANVGELTTSVLAHKNN